MAWYYIERDMDSGKIESVFAQDETGIYSGSLYDDGVIRSCRYASPGSVVAFHPRLGDMISLEKASLEYLDFARLYERCVYSRTKPSEIMEAEGSAEDVIRRVFREAEPDGVIRKRTLV